MEQKNLLWEPTFRPLIHLVLNQSIKVWKVVIYRASNGKLRPALPVTQQQPVTSNNAIRTLIQKFPIIS
ncbi:hypothetical protein GFPCMMHI_03543 [Ensifer adhaerens]|nr:hypothetical protein [Ensifer adhaerens]